MENTQNSIYRPNQLLKDAAKHGELVVFVGAGASMLCDSPDWREFANRVVRELEKRGVLSFLESEQLRALGESRRTLSIAMAIANERRVIIDFDSILHPNKPSSIGFELYELLSELRPVFVTTNYDKWLDRAGPAELSLVGKAGSESQPAASPTNRPTCFLREHLTPALLAERGSVIHLHGSYTDPNSMVVSLKDYITHYADKRVQAFLEAMFRNYTVLFVGYGLAEIEILDHIIRSNDLGGSSTTDPRHFLLYPYRSTESVQKTFIEQFFRDQCGVCVIPYCIDNSGYGEVVEVFRSWRSELDVRDPTTLDLQAHLDRYISLPSTENREAALRLVSKYPELGPYFLNTLKDVVWLVDLDGAGYFKPEFSPRIKVLKGEQGTSYRAENWPALRYLERIASSASGDQATRLVAIVREISADAHSRGLGNWRTCFSLAGVLSNLSLDVITDQDIEMAKSWLIGVFEPNMLGQQLGEKLLPRLLESSDPTNWRKALLLVDALTMLKCEREAA